jgi:hypothetical protein
MHYFLVAFFADQLVEELRAFCYTQRLTTILTRDLRDDYVFLDKYEDVSRIFRTGAAIYTAVVVAQNTGPNRSSCEFRGLMRHFAVTA